MPGLAKTNAFMLGTATVMLGAMSDLYDLNPSDNSIGLVKNFTLSSEPSFTELTQGVQNTVVDSTITGNPVRAQMEAYEYTAKNFAYALGLEGAPAMTNAGNTAQTTTSGAVTATSPAAVIVPVVSATDITPGKFLMIQIDNEDHFIIRKVVSVASLNVTVDKGLPAIPSGAKVRVVADLGIGSKNDQPYYAAQVNGKLSNGDPITILLPKVRIVRGFNLAFTTSDYGNMPLELAVYDQVSTDPFYTDFPNQSAKLLRS